MKLTLYRNCILNNSYTDVFDVHKFVSKDGQTMSVLDAYLAGLQKFEYENDFIYTEQSGSFQIELYPMQNAQEIYSYNYLKVEEMDDSERTVFKRYCFIDNITKIASDIVSVFYSEDVWSSYSGSMQIRDSIVCNTLRRPRAPYYLPIPYDGNNAPVFSKVDDFNGQFIIVCQLQVYNLEKDGVANKRLVYTVALAKSLIAAEPQGTKHAPSLFNETSFLNRLVSGMATKQLKTIIGSNDVQAFSYEIDNFTLIPATQAIIEKMGTFGSVGIIDTVDWEDNNIISIAMLDLNNRASGTTYDRIDYYQTTLQNDFKNISFGSILGQYELVPNGSTIPIKIELAPTNYDFKILMYVQNKVIDITNDFVVKMPFTSLNSEENTNRKIQREMATISGVFQLVEGTAETAIQVAGAVMTGGVSLLGGSTTATTQTGELEYMGKYSKRLKSWNRTRDTVSQKSSDAGSLVGGTMKIANGITNIVYSNKPKYSSTQGTFATSDGVTNAINGFGVVQINPDNEEYVTEVTNRIGYTVFMKATNYSEIFGHGNTYDIVKMLTVTLYGSFAQDINFQLTEILKNGVRIFYTDNVQI